MLLRRGNTVQVVFDSVYKENLQEFLGLFNFMLERGIYCGSFMNVTAKKTTVKVTVCC